MNHLDINQIKDIIPHRHPFLLIDYKIAQGLAARRAADAAAEVDDRALRRVDHLSGLFDVLLIIPGHGADELGSLGGELTGGSRDVLGNIDEDGTLAARLRNAEGCTHRVG